MSESILFVSLNPEDPELISIKGLNALRKANFIFCPATFDKDGMRTSKTYDMLLDLKIRASRIQQFIVVGEKDQSLSFEVLTHVIEETIELFEAGMKVVIVSEGDAGFYSSIQYIFDRLHRENIPVERIAGVPAFIVAGELAGIHEIVDQEEKLVVIPGIITEQLLMEFIQFQFTIVIVRLTQCIDIVSHCIEQDTKAIFHYFENIGLQNEYYTSDKNQILKREFPHASMMIIRP